MASQIHSLKPVGCDKIHIMSRLVYFFFCDIFTYNIDEDNHDKVPPKTACSVECIQMFNEGRTIKSNYFISYSGEPKKFVESIPYKDEYRVLGSDLALAVLSNGRWKILEER